MTTPLLLDPALSARIELAFHGIFNPTTASTRHSAAAASTMNSASSVSTWIRDFAIPMAVNASTAAQQRAWHSRLVSLARDACRRSSLELLNELEMLNGGGGGDSNSNNDTSRYIVQSTVATWERYNRATQFLCTVGFHVEQGMKEAAVASLTVMNNGNKASRENITVKARQRAEQSATLQHAFTEVFVTDFLGRLWQQEAASSPAAFLSNMAAAIADMSLTGSNKESRNDSSSHNIACKAVQILSLVSGFRSQFLLPELRRCITADLVDSSKCDAHDIFVRLQKQRTTLTELLSTTTEVEGGGCLEFLVALQQPISTNQQQTQQQQQQPPLRFRHVRHSPSDIDSLVSLTRIHLLGGRIGDTSSTAAVRSVLDRLLNQDTGDALAKAVLSPSASSPTAYELFFVCGPAATAAALSRQCEEYVVRVLEEWQKKMLMKESGSSDSNAASYEQDTNCVFAGHGFKVLSLIQPWLDFVMCPSCIAASPDISTPLPRCVVADSNLHCCCAGHTIVASALRTALQSAFACPKVSAFAMASLLFAFDNAVQHDSAEMVQRQLPLLQLVTKLPLEQSSIDNSRSKNAVIKKQQQHADPNDAAILSNTTDWTWAFHQLAFQRAIRQSSDEVTQLHQRELQCAKMLQHLTDRDSYHYTRKYHGLFSATIASREVVKRALESSTNGNGSDNSDRFDHSCIRLIPAHFAAFLPTTGGQQQQQQQQQLAEEVAPSLIWPSAGPRLAQQQIIDFVAQQSPSTRLKWLADDSAPGSCAASVTMNTTATGKKKRFVSGSPVQIALLYHVGALKRVAVSKINEVLLPLMFEQQQQQQQQQAAILRSALDALLASRLVRQSESDGGVLELNLDASHEESEHNDISAFSRSSWSRGRVIASVFRSAVKNAAAVAATLSSSNRRHVSSAAAAAAASSEKHEQEQHEDNDEQQHQDARSTSSNAANGNSTAAVRSRNIISTATASALAMRIIKRAGTLKMQEWLDATRALLSQTTATAELPSKMFRDVVDQLTQREFVEVDGETGEVTYLP